MLVLEDMLTAGDVDFESVVQVVNRITDIQQSIDKIIVRAASDIKRKRDYLDYLERTWHPHIAKLQASLKGNKKTVKLGTAGVVSFIKQGGFYVDDPDKLKAFMESLTDEQLAPFGASRRVCYRADAVVSAVAQTGEAVPGIDYIEPDDYATYRIGVNKPWSSKNLKQLISKAIDGTATGDSADDEA